MRRDLAYLVSEGYAGSLPAGTIPIAIDPHENLLLLSVADAGDTRIWFWDRECRGLDAQIDAMVMDLEEEGEDTLELDENQILRCWEALFPERVLPAAGNAPAGFTNVYAVADSFATFLATSIRRPPREQGPLEAFSDGVIAILITIMVLELQVPHGTDWAALRPLRAGVPRPTC